VEVDRRGGDDAVSEKMDIAERLYQYGFSTGVIQKLLGYRSKQSMEVTIARERKKGRFLPVRGPDWKPRLTVHDL
jgi:hypothetical protein